MNMNDILVKDTTNILEQQLINTMLCW